MPLVPNHWFWISHIEEAYKVAELLFPTLGLANNENFQEHSVVSESSSITPAASRKSLPAQDRREFAGAPASLVVRGPSVGGGRIGSDLCSTSATRSPCLPWRMKAMGSLQSVPPPCRLPRSWGHRIAERQGAGAADCLREAVVGLGNGRDLSVFNRCPADGLIDDPHGCGNGGGA